MSSVFNWIRYIAAGLCIGLVLSARVSGAPAMSGATEVEGVITSDTVWSGEVVVYSDVLVPEGVTLTVEPGTRVYFALSDSSKIEPMFLSMDTELLVRGVLVVKGTNDNPVFFEPAPYDVDMKAPERGDWGGIIFDGPGSSASVVEGALFIKADTAVTAYHSSPTLGGCKVEDSEYGFVFAGGCTPRLTGCTVTGAEFGVVSSHGARPVITGCDFMSCGRDILAREAAR
jgi:hypothetical protein